MTSWITYARPFAKRIRGYRKKIRKGSWEYAERAEQYIRAVKLTWAQFRDDLILSGALSGGVRISLARSFMLENPTFENEA